MIRYICFVTIALAAGTSRPQSEGVLPITMPLEWEEADLSGRLMDGAHAFVERKISESALTRKNHWNPDFSSPEAYARSVEPNRRRFAMSIGVVDPQAQVQFELYGNVENPPLVSENDWARVYQVRWTVLEGVSSEGLWLQPKRTSVRGAVVFVPDAGQTPEEAAGLADARGEVSTAVAAWVAGGLEVLIPTLVDRRKIATGDRDLQRSDQTHREWIYRQAFHMGRHIIGYEVQKVLAAVDWFERRHAGVAKTGVAGYGEGGLIAFYSAALDPRIHAALVSGYFSKRDGVWSEPIYRNVFGLLKEFGDAEIASLVAPSLLLVEHSAHPEVTGHKGDIRTPDLRVVQEEMDRITTPASLARPRLFVAEQEPNGLAPLFGSAAKSQFAAVLGALAAPSGVHLAPLRDSRRSFDPEPRHDRLFRQLESHVQTLVRRSEHTRDEFFLFKAMPEFTQGRWSTRRRHDTFPPDSFIEASKEYRRIFLEEAMGRFDEPMLPPNPRTRKVSENPFWTAYDVVLDVYPELFAWGVLVLPKDLKPGERRPVVVCQHGRNGLPRDTIDGNNPAYNNFAGKLAERGFITFAPHNLYRGEDRYRWLDRKSNSIGCTLFSFIIAQHDQILRWLRTLPFVDAGRIAFYGLSYGGETAMRVPSVLEGYCLSICSGDFNQWTRKVAATDQPFSFMRTIEWEMPYWNLGHTFDYAEMAYLIFPRPFMVERGHWDLVSRDQWVAHEYAKVRWLYAQFGLEDRTEIEFFQGGHSINGERTFDFLHKHLEWPRR